MLKSTTNKNLAVLIESRISKSIRKVSFGPILSHNSRFRRSDSWPGVGRWLSGRTHKKALESSSAGFAVKFRKYLGFCFGIFAAAFGTMYVFPGTFDSFKGRFTFLAARREHSAEGPGISKREKRFLAFASLEYHGEVFMSPRDFLDCVTRDHPRSRVKRKHLTEADMHEILKRTPDFDKGSKNLFRRVDADGIISYTEYLFLLCILTKPEEGFKIAFNMFDTDGDNRVDKKEFLVIQALILMLRSSGKIASVDALSDSLPDQLKVFASETSLKMSKKSSYELADLLHPRLESVIGRGKRRLKRRAEKVESSGEPTNSQIVKAKPGSSKSWVWSKSKEIVTSTKVQETSLLTHFFGPKGNRTLTYDDFRKFMDNLQTEVLEIEFNEFSGGMNNISESDFARILLRYSTITTEERKSYIRRVHERIPDEGEGITFEQFRLFCRFLNTLDDFTIAVKLYTFADLPVSQAEFARAVKVATGFALEPHVVDVVFKIFDVNNDGRLSYSEFIAVMKERLHRGFRTRTVPTEGWPAFKKCVREELKRY